ncbi:MAG TPA: hypothetical protein PKE39_07600 [Ignavibacteria bacterium]|nr:hypothetical protein [Ignavibacteria bacterium]HMQ98875.1 hypothetical protein [Ignavibacteria bacterium]
MGKLTLADDARLLFEKTISTESGKELITSLVAGGIEISTWDKNEVNVKVYGNDEAEEKIIFTAEQTSTGVKVEGKQKDQKNVRNLTIRVEIVVPKSYDLKLYSSGGNLSVKDITGKIETNTSGGNIKIDNTAGNLEAYTAGGNVSISISSGDIKVSTSGGKITVDDFNGNVDVSTAGGDIVLEGKNGKIDASTAGGSIKLDYTGKNMGIDMSTLGGNITASLPGDFDADADIGTLAGKITCDFAKVQKDNHVSSYVRAKFNNGGETFKCTTSAGNITVTKK